jgi:ABC-2 type transport system permease protein
MPEKEYKNKISHYFKIWFIGFKAGIKKSKAYKSEIIIRIIRTLFILFTQVLLLTLVYGNQKVYAGWTKDQAYLIIGIWNILNYTGWGFFGVNLEYLENKVLMGDFDHILLKPLPSAWYASFCDFSLYNWLSSLSGVALIAYYLIVNIHTITLENILLGALGILVGLIIWYSMYLLLASFALVNPRNGYMALAKEILALTKFPTDIYTSSLQFVFYTILPIAFVSTVPATIFSGKGNSMLLIGGAVLSLVFLGLGITVWNRNLKKYISAGG